MDPEIVNHPLYAGEISNALQSIPTVSLSMNIDDWFNPATGLYVGYPNSDISREKAVKAEFLFPDKQQNFVIECGVQNQGGTSIVNWKVPKQSMRLLFKEMYGPTKLDYKLFPDSDIKSINTLVLDGFLYSWVHPFDEKQRNTTLYFRDQLASDRQNKMGWPSFHGIYVNLFINGLYWGLYDLHECPDDAFLAEHLNASREDFDIIKHNPNNIVQGSNVAYNEMLELARKGVSTPEALKNIQKYLDLPAFIDYMILNFYLGNFDWAHQNYYAARNKVLKTGFRFYTWDAEHVMRYSGVTYTKNEHWVPQVDKVLEEYIPKRRYVVLNQLRYNSPKLSPETMPPVFMVENQSSNSHKKVELINPNNTEGDIYYTLDGSDPRAPGGTAKGLKYTKAITLENSSVIKTRFISKSLEIWSDLAEKPVLFDGIYGEELMITEIMYHPQNGYPEFVELVNTVDSVFYSDTIPWPLAADGDGYSLELINPLSDNSVYNNWKESDMMNGTPFEPKTGQKLHATLYPNPFNEVVYIEIENQGLAYEPFIIEVFNLFGNKVKSLEIISYYSKIQIPTGDLSQGVYIIHIQPKQNSDFKAQSLKAIKL